MPLSWLYVPGDRPERFEKAAAAGADVVIVDLEDSVVPAAKVTARAAAVSWLASGAAPTIEIRVNALNSPWGADDLQALADVAALRAVRLPKVGTADDVKAALELLPSSDCGFVCLLETALGIENAYQIGSASPRVIGIGLGEADLASDLGASGPDGLTWARSRVVVAARAAGLAAPAMSAYTNVSDLDGLARTSRQGRAIGFVGRAAIHPRQVLVIAEAFRPTAAELDDARAVLDAYEQSMRQDTGVTVLPDGRMIDAAMIKQARRIVALAP